MSQTDRVIYNTEDERIRGWRGAWVVVWICPLCGWYPPNPHNGWSGECAAGHEKVKLVARDAVLA